ncbi:MAG TPA: glycosyltransferase [Roseiflexaceae bacterium]|nr:glycosyltransferase [Roseiflexaceae bacterium]
MVSVVIPNLHSPIIDQVIAALDRQTARAAIDEIIVVGQDRYNRIPPHVTLLATPRPITASAARNRGVAHATSRYILLLDADCIAAPECVERLLACHRAGHRVVGAGIMPETADYWVTSDNLIGFFSALAFLPAGTRPYLPSFALSMERSVYETVGGFDEQLPVDGADDQEFCYRLARHGVRFYFEPAAHVFHRPQRADAASVWRHLQGYGRAHAGIQRRYRDVTNSRLRPQLAPLAILLLAAAPFLALFDLLRLVVATSGLRRYWRFIPGMVWGRCAWYWGVAQALQLYAAGRHESVAWSR